MSKHYLIAREKEQNFLKDAESSSGSEFLAVFGRRRIGKTYLIQEYFSQRNIFFDFTGTKGASPKVQIKNFLTRWERFFKKETPENPQNWSEALALLASALEALPKHRAEKKIIFFDELPWLAGKKSGFLEALDYLWNSFLSKRKDIILIVCGSSASWMISKVVNHKGGLHNRITRPALKMSPFTLKETKEYLLSRGIDLEDEQIVELYMVTGGVAYYLDQYQKGQSAAQFINKNFFSGHGELHTEFDRLFQSLFDDFDEHVKIVKVLAKHPRGLPQSSIAEKTKKESGGTFSKILDELLKSDFIQFIPQMGSKKKNGTYRLTDEYTLFYLTWVAERGTTFRDEVYWQKQVGKPRYNSWLGHAFEALCFKHAGALLQALGITGLTTHIFTFSNDMAQIDLVIDRSDKVVNLCEMKYTSDPFELSEGETNKIKERKKQLSANLKRKKQIFITLVTPFAAKKNKHYLNLVDNEINLEALFK